MNFSDIAPGNDLFLIIGVSGTVSVEVASVRCTRVILSTPTHLWVARQLACAQASVNTRAGKGNAG